MGVQRDAGKVARFGGVTLRGKTVEKSHSPGSQTHLPRNPKLYTAMYSVLALGQDSTRRQINPACKLCRSRKARVSLTALLSKDHRLNH